MTRTANVRRHKLGDAATAPPHVSRWIPWREWPWLIIWKLADRGNVHGIDVRVFDEEGGSIGEVRARIANALELMIERNAVRFHKLRRDLRGVLVTSPSGASFIPHLRVCRLGLSYVLKLSPLELAMALVHESTHARLFRMGCSYDGAERERVERTCIAAEVAFARRFPNSDAEIQRAQALLERRWWENVAQARSAARDLRQLGVPAWVVKMIVPRHRKDRSREVD
jgi:hypothetical protein